MAAREESARRQPNKEHPVLLDLLNQPFSLPFQLLQYWSSVARRPASWSRISLVLVRYGAVDYRDWAELFPDAADTLSRAVLALMAAIRRRLWRNIVQEKEIFVISDDRRTKEDREGVSKRLLQQNHCCRALGMHREFIRCLHLPVRLDAENNFRILMQKNHFPCGHFHARVHCMPREAPFSITSALARKQNNVLPLQRYFRGGPKE